MDQIKKLLESLSLRQRLTIAAAAVAVFGGLLAFSHWRTESDFRPLYTSMSPEDAAVVLQKLKESGCPYRLAENGTGVLVPSSRLAELRLQLAGAGLPKSGRIGFEFFDKTNFGVTEFVEHINYRRALEGELERSVMSLAEVEQARIHLTFPKDSVFLEAQQPAKASIMVKLKPGARISPRNVLAICNLVASAVEGLAPESVSVVDMNGNLLSRPRKPGNPEDAEATAEVLELRQKLERDLVAKIEATLEPLLGADRFRAGASVDCETTSGEQNEETFDPAKSVMLTSQKTEDSSPTPISTAGVPGTGSNMPRPTSRPTTAVGGLTRVTENVTYQSSRVTKHTRMPQGAIKRMSVSVLVDYSLRWEGEGVRKRRVLTPPTPEALKSIREVVAAVTGLAPDRGDQLIIESLPFESTLNREPPPAPAAPVQRSPFNLPKNLLIAIGVAAAGILFLLIGVVFRLRRRKKKAALEMRAAIAADEPKELAEGEAEDVLELGAEGAAMAQLAKPKVSELMTGTAAKLQQLTELIREIVNKDAPGSCNVVRTWLSEDDI